MPRPHLALLVGEVGSGKTTVCLRLAELASARALRVGGIVTRALRDGEGRKTGLEALDLWTRESRLLARVDSAGNGSQGIWCPSPLCQGPHHFDPAVFAWAGAAVAVALAEGAGLVILDEVGPLELERGLGFAPWLGQIISSPCSALLVVRRACLPALQARLPGDAALFSVTAATRDGLPAAIVDMLCPQCKDRAPHLT